MVEDGNRVFSTGGSMFTQNQLYSDSLSWLLETDNPGVRFLALRDLCQLEVDGPELAKARSAAHREGQIAVILDQMDKAGYWVEAGAGYNPKYRPTVWLVIRVVPLGGSVD